MREGWMSGMMNIIPRSGINMQLLLVCVTLILVGKTTAYRIPVCLSDGVVTVREDTTTTVVCDGIGSNEDMYWYLSPLAGGRERIGDCSKDGSCTTTNALYSLTRPAATRSELVLDGNLRNNRAISCSESNNRKAVSCGLRFVYPGVPSDCRLDVLKDTWEVRGSCSVEKIYNSHGVYSCRLLQTNPDQQQVEAEGRMPLTEFRDESGRVYYKGTCSFNTTLPATDGNYMYHVKLQPGQQNYRLQTVEIEEPDDPKHNCPQFVVENATLTCRCTPSSDKPGKPAPNLVWRGYSNTNDLMIPSVQRRDGNTTYTCQLTWGPAERKTERNAVYTLQVAYGPSRVVISNTSGFVSTRSGFLFCRADDVNPAARYSWSGVTCSADSGPDDGSMCSFIPRPEDGGNVVTCTATNTASETLSGSVTQTIDVNYPPPAKPVISGYKPGEILYETTNVTLTCNVNGGKPQVSSVRFFCGTLQEDDKDVLEVGHVSSQMTIGPLIVEHNGTTCLCSANWSTEPELYMDTSDVTLLVNEAEHPRVTLVTLNGQEDDLIITHGDAETVTLRCAASGRPKPSIRVVRVDTGQPLEADTSHTSGEDENVQQYTLTTSARCQDAAIYRCQASNGKGTDEKSVKLYVNCLPKLNEDSQYSGSPSNPVLLNITDVEFSLLAFPEPEAHDIVYLGPTPPDPSLTNAEQKSTALLAECRHDVTTLYMSLCTVSASNAVKGFYRVTLTNLFGSVDVFVKLEQTIGAEPAQAVPMSAIGSVVGATVLIIIIITVAFLVIAAWRRKKKPDQSSGIREKKEDEETGRRTSEVHVCSHNFGANPKKRYKKQTKHAKSNSLKRPQADELTDTQTAEAQTEPTENKSPPSVDLETNKASASLAAGSSKGETAEAARADAISEINRVEEETNDVEAGYSTLSFTGEPQPLIAVSREGSTSNVGKGLVYEDPYSTVDDSDQNCGANVDTRTELGSQDGNTHDDECSEKVQSNGDVGEVGNAAVGNTKRVEHTPDNTDFTTTVPAESPYSSDGDVYAQVNKLHKEGSSAENSSSQVQENQGVTRSASEDKDQVQNIRSTGDDNTNIGQFSSDTPPSSPS